nr:TetR/AcrR family transcriptional regulator [Jiella flava]
MTPPRKTSAISRPNRNCKRNIIITAALQAMIDDGLYRATTRKIAEYSGVNLATLHYHFSNKEEIFFCAMETLIAQYRENLESRFEVPQTLHDRISDLVLFIWGAIEARSEEQLALQEMTLYLLRHAEANKLALDKDREFLSLYVDMLATASDAPDRGDPKLVTLANLLYTGLVGLINQWLATRDRGQMTETLDALIASVQHVAAQPVAASRAVGACDC